MLDRFGRPLGAATVLYEDADAAEAAIKEYNGRRPELYSVGAELDKHVLVIKYAQPRNAGVPKEKGPNAIQKRLVVTKPPTGGAPLDRSVKRRVRIV